MDTQKLHNIALVFSQSVAALAEIEAMKAENQHRMNCGNSIAYGDEAFFAIIEKYNLHWNGVITLLNSGI